jgi:hypothetical protein
MATTSIELTANTITRKLDFTIDGASFNANDWFQEDYISVRLVLIKTIRSGSAWSSESVDPTGLSFVLKVGELNGSVLASQDSWTVETSGGVGVAANGVLNLNTSEMQSALTGKTAIEATLELQATDTSGHTFTCGQRQVRIYRELNVGTPTEMAPFGPVIAGNGAPDADTPGTFGQQYWDDDANALYIRKADLSWKQLLSA